MSAHCIPQIGIVVCGEADLANAREAVQFLRGLRIPFTVTALDALAPDDVREYARTIARRGVEVVVAVGSTMSHLAGRIAAYTTLPVIVVPTCGADQTAHSVEWGTLLASLETPPGVPLAVVGVNAVYNAVYLAVQMLGVKDHRVRAKLADLRSGQAARARERTEAVEACSRGIQGDYQQPALTPVAHGSDEDTRDGGEAIPSSPGPCVAASLAGAGVGDV